MQIYLLRMCLLSLLWFSTKSLAQGPPITADKPIMLGSGSWVIKTLTEIRKTTTGTFLKVPLILHYLPTSNSLIGVHIPYVTHTTERDNLSKSTLGAIELFGKYQFYRKDQKGKTFRMVVKTVQTLPTGITLIQQQVQSSQYQNYTGLVAGYESIKYGISNEIGFLLQPRNDFDELRYKLGFGLPLLKSTYPVKQINLYFEYENSWFITIDEFQMLYAQGLQYAKGRITVETAVQFPALQTFSKDNKREVGLFFGMRYIL